MFADHLEVAGNDYGNTVKKVAGYKALLILQYTAQLPFDMHEIT